MAEEKWLEGYAGQSVDELLAMAGEYRIDSIVLAFEQALQDKAERVGLEKLAEAEQAVLAIESLEREVNNGGYHQFFVNTPQYAPLVLPALERIGCPATAAITADAIARMGLRAPFTVSQVEDALARDREVRLAVELGEACDGRYYDSGEPIADRLFAYLKANRQHLRL